MESSEKFKYHSALIMLVLTAVLWSTGGLLIKSINLHPMAIASIRSLLAVPVLFIILRPADMKFSKSQVSGAVFYAVCLSLYAAGNKLTTAANTIVLQYTAPIYIALLSGWMLKETVSRIDWISIVAVLAGMVMFFLDDLTGKNIIGNIFGIFCGITFALMIISLRMQKDAGPVGSVFLGNLFVGIIGLPFALKQAPSATDWAYLILLGMFQVGLAYVFYCIAIKHVTALEGIMIPVIEPVLNPVLVFMFLGERPGKWAVPGALIVISAVLFSSIHRIKQNSKSKIDLIPETATKHQYRY